MEEASKVDRYIRAPISRSLLTSFRLVARLTGYREGASTEPPVPLRPDASGRPSLAEDRRNPVRRERLDAKAEALALSPDRVYESVRKRKAIVETVTQSEVVPRVFDT